MAEFRMEFDGRLPRRLGPGSLAALLVCALAGELSPESVTLTTYYPAPSGVYTRLITTGNTYLARDGGSLGIGTVSPDGTSKLHVLGTMLLQSNSTLVEGRVSGATKMRVKIESPNLNFYGYDTAEFNFMRVSNSGARKVYFPVKVGFNTASPGADADVTGVAVSKQPESQCVATFYAGGGSTTPCPNVGGMPSYATMVQGILSVQSMPFGANYSSGSPGQGYMLCCQCPTNPCPTLPE